MVWFVHNSLEEQGQLGCNRDSSILLATTALFEAACS